MSQRDSGWIQLYAQTNQDAADLHVIAFRLAEELSVPVMVCMDGFILTHAFEAVEVPGQDLVDAYLPPFRPRQMLDPSDPVSIGAMVGPEAFTEVRYMAHERQLQAIGLIERLADEYSALAGRSVDGLAIGALGITAFRPFPYDVVDSALRGAQRVVVLERALAVGVGGIVSVDVRRALPQQVPCHTVVAGLGGRPVMRASLRRLFADAAADNLEELTFLDLDRAAVNAAERG
jgi:pyruvate ferredoxin oxidoreductase alpha subunit